MKLFRVSFPDILVVEKDQNSLDDRIEEDLEDSQFYNDLVRHYEVVEVINEEQISDVSDDYVPYGKSPVDMPLKEVFELINIINDLSEKQKSKLFELIDTN